VDVPSVTGLVAQTRVSGHATCWFCQPVRPPPLPEDLR